MNTDDLLAAVREAPDWMDKFNRKEYEKAFKTYGERFGPLYTQTVQATGGEESALTALTGELLDELESGWKRQRIWNRSAVRVNEKQMMVSFLSPMLLDQEEPLCARLAELLRDGWAARWPKDAYGITTYARLKRGFRNAILGIDLANRHLDPERDREN